MKGMLRFGNKPLYALPNSVSLTPKLNHFQNSLFLEFKIGHIDFRLNNTLLLHHYFH